MENQQLLNVVFGAVSSILLGVVAFFIRQLHSDFKKMEKDITEVKTTALLIKTEFKNSYDLLSQRVEYLETRIKNLELFNLKNKRDEKG